MELKEELKQAALDWLGNDADSCTGVPLCSARAIRRGSRGNGDISGLVAAMLDIFDGYEEVEVDERTSRANRNHFTNVAEREFTWCDRIVRRVTILMKKPEPEPKPVTISRETLAVLAEHYRDTPGKDSSGDAALAEAEKVL